jgi:hypothetical protein
MCAFFHSPNEKGLAEKDAEVFFDPFEAYIEGEESEPEQVVEDLEE